MKDALEEKWIRRARQGDREAFAELVRRYEKQVLALTRRMLSSPQDAEEAAQEAFLSAWQGLSAFRGESSFSTWLYRLASNACVDILRREGRRRALSGPSLDDEARLPASPDPSPQALAERAELREQIETALSRLSPEHRQVLLLREMHQLSYEEIARALSLDVGTVKSRISRGRQALRRILLQSGNFSPPDTSKKTGKTGKEGRQ